MRGVVDFLSAEVPDVDAKGFAVVWELPAADINAFGGEFLFLEFVVGVEEFFREGGFSGFTFADDEEFGLVEFFGVVGIAGLEVEVEDGSQIACFVLFA